MKLRHLPTKRKLKKENENFRCEIRHLKTELRNARTDLALEQVTSSGYKHENEKLRAMLFGEPHSGFECVGVTEVPYE